MINSLKAIIKKSKFLYPISVYFYNALINIIRGINVHLMIIFLRLFPNYIYKLSKREVLPTPKKKISLKHLKFPPFEVINSKSDLLPKVKEVNFVSTGCKDFSFLHNTNVPTYLSAFWDTLKIDDNGNILYKPEFYHPSFYQFNKDQKKVNSLKDYRNKNITYIHNVTFALKKIKDRGHKVIAFISNYEDLNGNFYENSEEVNIKPVLEGYKNYNHFLEIENIQKINFVEKIFKPANLPPSKKWFKGFPPVSSLWAYLSVIFNYAEKINVYGWDFYLNKSPKKMSSFELLNKIYNYKLDTKYSNFLFEAGLLNLYYGLKFSENPKININGFMGDLENHKKLINDIEKVFFK